MEEVDFLGVYLRHVAGDTGPDPMDDSHATEVHMDGPSRGGTNFRLVVRNSPKDRPE